MRPEKESIANELRTALQSSDFCIVTDYVGLPVSKTEELRKRLHENSARMLIVRNRVLALVAKEQGLEDLEPSLKGPTAIIVGGGDVVGTSKTLKAFIKEFDKPVIKMGALDGRMLSATDISDLASLPGREQLLATLVGTLAAPMTQLVGVMQQKVASLVYVLNAVREKKEQQG